MNVTLLSLTASCWLAQSPCVTIPGLILRDGRVRFSFAPFLFSNAPVTAQFKRSSFSMFLSAAAYVEHADYSSASFLDFDSCTFTRIDSATAGGAFVCFNTNTPVTITRCSFVYCSAHGSKKAGGIGSARSGGAFIAFCKSGHLTQSTFYGCTSDNYGSCFTVECPVANTYEINCTTLINPLEVKRNQATMALVDYCIFNGCSINFTSAYQEEYTILTLHPGYTPTWDLKFILFDGFHSTYVFQAASTTGTMRYLNIIDCVATTSLFYFYGNTHDFYNCYVLNTTFNTFWTLASASLASAITFTDCVSDATCSMHSVVPGATIDYQASICPTASFTSAMVHPELGALVLLFSIALQT